MEPEQSAEFLNNYFTGIGPKLAKGLDPSKWAPGEPKRFKIAKASGYSHLSTKVLKDSFLVLTAQLTYIFNVSLRLAIFPDDLKVATIIPLHKGGSREEVGNYRPVSLLPLPGKILERIVHVSLTTFLEENNILVENQGGFRKK